MTTHCKTCRKEKEPSKFLENNKTYKTCNDCRPKKRITKKYTIEQCKEFAISKNGECLSDEYKNSKTKLNWKCSEGHEWSSIFSSIKRGCWCPKCGYQLCIKNRTSGSIRLNIKQCKEFAISKGGECLSEEYKNNRTKLNWKCSEGHEWKTATEHIMSKINPSWCPICSNNIPLTIEQCKEFAISKNGECLSEEYKNNKTKLNWKCSEGHEWSQCFSVLKSQGCWCPVCSKNNKSENVCREILEHKFCKKFPTKRPKFLKGLELDGYNEELNLAFEYNGKQHYQYNKHFHRGDPELFEKQKSRDRKKYRICAEKNINLIIIPYQYNHSTPDELKNFIFREIEKLNI